ncbi:MAG: hypothetical protein BGP13_08540 [Sphingobacteriales bacterium 40-81]|nr:MAG: hypothetical protein BGP13_08540 [Sphingobacteriales bacterium 40-81]
MFVYPEIADSAGERLVLEKNDLGIKVTIYTKELLVKQRTTLKNSYFEINTDQDVFAPGTNGRPYNDQDYTMGVGLQWHKDTIANELGSCLLKIVRIAFLPENKNPLVNLFGKTDYSSFYSHGLLFSAFTPYTIEKYIVDSTDRPYAANFMFSSRRTLFNDWWSKEFKSGVKFSVGRQLRFDGAMGLIGKIPSNIAQFVQSGIHAGQAAVINDTALTETRPIPRGWPNAIANPKSKFIFNNSIGFSVNFLLAGFSKNCIFKNLKISGDVGGKLDYGLLYNNIGPVAGAEIGWFEINNFSRPNSILYKQKDNVVKKHRFGVSFLVRYEGNFWLWNSNLRGLLLGPRSHYELSEEQTKNWTNYFEYGLRVKLWNFNLSYLLAKRSRVADLPSNTIQRFGRLSLIVNY